MKAYLVANGERCADDVLVKALKEADIIIAVDGGLNHLKQLSIVPDIVIGDMDSAQDEGYNFEEIISIKLPTEKDVTDLEYAVNYAVECGAKSVIIYNAYGGRIDHFMTNLLLLHRQFLNKETITVEFRDGNQCVSALKQHKVITTKKGQTFSIIPQSTLKGLSISGAKYNLDNANIEMGSSRCQSNIAMKSQLDITLQSGLALIVLNRLGYER